LSNKLAPFQSFFRKYSYLFAAFLIPLSIRSIPEILSWPYPLGLDTLNITPQIQHAWVFSLSPIDLLHNNTSFFFLITTLLNELFHNPVIVIKILGPLLLAFLSFTMFLYAKKGLFWSDRKSLVVPILVATYFISLRDSWDLYRQTLGLVFLMAVFISLKSFNSPRRYYTASCFMILTVFSHELPSVILFFIIALQSARLFIGKLRKDSIYLLASVALPAALFFYHWYSPLDGVIAIPESVTASSPSISLAAYMIGLLVYSYAIIMPLVILGFKGLRDKVLRYWILLCVGIVSIEIFYPNAPLFFWNRWVYLLVYPLLFFVVEGLHRLLRFAPKSKNRVKHLIPKTFAISYCFMLLILSGFYLTTSPESSFPYFSQYNPYLNEIPSSMLQNTISIEDNPSLFACFEWLNNNTVNSSVTVLHYSLSTLAAVYMTNRLIVPVQQGSSYWDNVQNGTQLADQMLSTAKEYSAGGQIRIYTIWWSNGDGWYGIRTLPSDFIEVYHFGKMSVYFYNP
jgi:hypothetical protein